MTTPMYVVVASLRLFESVALGGGEGTQFLEFVVFAFAPPPRNQGPSFSREQVIESLNVNLKNIQKKGRGYQKSEAGTLMLI